MEYKVMLKIRLFISACLLVGGMIALPALEASAAPKGAGNSNSAAGNSGGGNSGGGNSGGGNSGSTSSGSTSSGSTSSGSTAPAAPTVTASCKDGGIMAGLVGFTSCISGVGNDVQSGKQGEILYDQLATGVFGGLKNWSLLGKVNDGETGSNFNWTNSTSSGNKGTWSVKTPIDGPFVLSLKSGTAWSAYYFASASAVTQGTWDTLGVVTGQKPGQALSHASIFVAPATRPQEVPEPATFVGLGLVGAASLKMRRRIQQKAVTQA
jgi:hypothetical protein